MKRLAAVVVAVALFALPAYAQRGGSHPGFSGSHAGFSGSHTSAATHGAPSFHGASSSHAGPAPFRGSAPGRLPVAPRSIAGRPPYAVSGRPPYIDRTNNRAGMRQPYSAANHYRMPYHSPYGRDRHDRDRDRDRNRFGIYGWNPLWPGWGLGWGYPYLPDYFDDSSDYNAQSGSNYADSQPYPDDGFYAEPADQPGPEQPAYTPWPYSRPAPSDPQLSTAPSSSALVSEAPVTVVFKDGRPSETIHNYLLTATTLSVLDQQRHEIPVDQIDLAATAKANRNAGIEFSLPGGGSR